ncbi:MAG: hypothetical protein HY901_25295 [Deltaproteobacteria bacterium]|nr:hypothetical protein [Deltaproteobacteria bacterium]
MRVFPRICAVLAAAWALLAAMGCGGLEGGGPTGSGQVSGSAFGESFSFEPRVVSAQLITGGVVAELIVDLCEFGCPGEADLSRALRLTVRSGTADLRSGRSFPIGPGGGASALVQSSSPAGQVDAQEAVGGEVDIDSSDLREGGMTVGTFQALLASGESIGGFFEAPIEVSGPVVVLGLEQGIHEPIPAAPALPDR